mmetsp:Transcript_43822/g.95086  ORF Transcript_43822/g.95086 Transcript_43822/m.95086 type:complete len:717 (+) Transcript_43822:62-2212(+)
MQEAWCNHPGCGAKIGGRSHVSVAGNTEVETAKYETQKTTVKGYNMEATQDYDLRLPGWTRGRMSPVGIRMLRFIIHATFAGAISTIAPEAQRSDALCFTKVCPNLRRSTLNLRIRQDWNSLAEFLQISDADLALLFALVTSKMQKLLPSWGIGNLRTSSGRNKFEHVFERDCLHPFMGPRLQKALSLARQGAFTSQTTRTLELLLGADTWVSIQAPPPQTGTAVWWPRQAVTHDTILRYVLSDPEHVDQCPLLYLVLTEEETLQHVSCLADIVAWHAVLFECFVDGQLSRDKAATITNAQAIETLPPHKRANAESALKRFCVAFNTALPLLPYLYECQRNPFLTMQGRVDLSGSGTGDQEMSPDTPVVFSLPSMNHGESDAAGMCTVQLIALLQRTHNELVEKMWGLVGGEDKTTPPVVSWATSPELIRSRVVDYSRERDLMPLACATSVESVSESGTVSTHLDLPRLERLVGGALLAGKTEIVTHTRHYRFAGETHKTGTLAALRVRVPQQPLPSAIEEAIVRHVDTKEQLDSLFTHLEGCINFLALVGGPAVVGVECDMLVDTYITRVLGVGAEEWRRCCPVAVVGALQLRHLAACLLLVEGCLLGGTLTRVSHRYREALAAEDSGDVARWSARLDARQLVSALRDLLDGPLSDPDMTFDAAEPIKTFLLYQDVDLEDNPNFMRHFPESLSLSNALSLYEALVERSHAAHDQS